MADEAIEFWNAFEKETGEKVEARSIGEWLQDKGPSMWGLVILTDKSFRFKHLPSENWLTPAAVTVCATGSKPKASSPREAWL